MTRSQLYTCFLLFAWLLPLPSVAQPLRFGHEWINPQQTYLKISVAQSGIYRITFADLQQANVPITTIKPSTFQVFRRGLEQEIYVEGQADGRFDTADFIEFYGQANDGELDSTLYTEAGTQQPHQYYSLFSDTAVYFLTWRLDGLAGKRKLTTSDTITTPFYEEQDLRLFTSDYPGYPAGIAGKAESSLYEDGEGYTGPARSSGQLNSQHFTIVDSYRSSASPTIEVLLTGRTAGIHHVQLWVGPSADKLRRVDSVVFDGFGNQRLAAELSWNDIAADGQLLVATVANNASAERYSMSYMLVKYQRRGKRSVQTLPSPGLHPVTFLSLANRKPTYLIVTHDVLRKPIGNTKDVVQDYAAYRASAAGGGFDTLIVQVQQLFDLFTFGERSPFAIRQFLRFMFRQSQPRFLLLLGQARSVPGIRHNPQQTLLDLVPTYGFPGSDMLFSAGLNGFPTNIPALPTGRVNAGSPQEVLNYFNKVKEYEALGTAIWRKKLLHLSGGRSPEELPLFRSFIEAYKRTAEQSALGANVQLISKQTDEPVETLNAQPPVNEGVGLITFFGHSSLSTSDLDIGLVSNEVLGYRNKGKYPFLLINGCAMGNFFFGQPTLATDWIVTPDRGAIAALAHSHLGYIASLHNYATAFYSVITDSTQISKSVGEWQQETVRRALSVWSGAFDLANAQQMVLQGDPAIRIFPFTKPDYSLSSEQFWVKPASQSDSIRLGLVITNTGLFRSDPLAIRIQRWYDGNQYSTINKIMPQAIAYQDTLWITVLKGAIVSEKQTLIATVNPEHSISESDYTNNQVAVEVNLQQSDSATAIAPDRVPPLIEVAVDGQFIQNQAIVSTQPTLTIQVIDDNRLLVRHDTTGLDLYLQGPGETTPFRRLPWKFPGVQTSANADNTIFQVTYPLPRLASGTYHLLMQAQDLSGNRAAPYHISFTIVDNRQLTDVTVYPNPFSHYQTIAFTLTGDLPPDDAEVQITDLTGHIICQIHQSARIGLNQWGWDGRTANGDLLPSGVYVYRLSLKANGIDWPATDKARRQQQGHIILIR